MINSNDTFRKNVTYGNIKSHQKSGSHPLSRKHNFGKTTRGGWVTLTPNIFRVNIISRLIAFMSSFIILTQPAFTCSKLTIETLEQGVKYVQS